MDFHTSRSTAFDVQRHALAEHLHALCKARSVDTILAERIIIALDLLDVRRFDKIQRETLERFPEDNRYNSYLDFCHHIYKAMNLYLRFIEGKRDVAETTGRNRKILDIGSGSGAFSFICNALGHHAIGMDKPRCDENDPLIPLNYQLTQWYNVDVIEHAIGRMAPLPMADLSFDDFAMFYPTFYRKWKRRDWHFFFSELTRCATKNDSRFHVKISTPKMDEPGKVHFSVDWFLKSIATFDHYRVGKRGFVIRLT